MDNLKIFYAKVMEDETLAAKFEKILADVEDEITDEQCQKVVELAKEVGVEISVEDIKNYIDLHEKDSETLTDAELEMVAGGKSAKDVRDDMEPVVNTLKWVKDIHVHCFTADSKVATPSGDRVISDIKVGDEVFSVDAQNNKVVSKVTEVRPTVNEEIYKVEFSNGATWFTTSSQWFYCGNDDYACAIDSQGKAALTEGGATATVANVTKTGEVQKVYDFIVGGVNVFFVGGIAAEGYSVD